MLSSCHLSTNGPLSPDGTWRAPHKLLPQLSIKQYLFVFLFQGLISKHIHKLLIHRSEMPRLDPTCLLPLFHRPTRPGLQHRRHMAMETSPRTLTARTHDPGEHLLSTSGAHSSTTACPCQHPFTSDPNNSWKVQITS